MREIEEKLYTLKNMEPVSSEARKTFDQSYRTILLEQEEKRSWKKNRLLKSSFLLFALLIIGIFISLSPIGQAVSRLLDFGKTTSETLNHSNFISQQSGASTDKGITVHLEQVYADQKVTAFHFLVTVPKKSELLKERFDEFTLNFALIDSSGKVLMDLNSGLEKDKKEAEYYTGQANIDRENQTIEFTYTYYGNGQELSSLEKTHIQVTKITASDSSLKKAGQGLQTPEEKKNRATVKGKWKVPVESAQIKEFPTLTFIPVDKNLRKDLSITVTPTSLIADIKVSSGIGKGGTPENMWVSSSSKTIKEQKFNWREAKTYERDNETYYRVVFDYPNYDSSKELTLHFPDKDIRLKQVK
jgi:hypothetical protein